MFAAAFLLLFSDLHTAVRSGELPRVKELLEKGTNANERDSLGGTALHDACWAGDVRMADLLLDHRADPNLRHLEGGSAPLHYAVITNHADVVELLLRRGADLRAKSATGATALHLAANRGFLPLVELLIARGLDPDTKDGAGNTALDEAAWKGEIDVARFLIGKGLDPAPALPAAAAKGHAEFVRMLLGAGARPEGRAVEEAVQNRHAGVIAAFLEKGARIDEAKLLHEGVMRGQLDLVKLLAGRRKRLDLGGYLADASLKGHAAVVEYLLELGADPNRRSKEGSTPLHDAALGGHVAAARALIGKGARVDAPDGDTGATPLHHAASWGRAEMVRLLLEKGANPKAVNRAGATAADVARSAGHTTLEGVLKQSQ
ncbi:MAG: hypothetical protein FJW39_21900 [Acidobacteria bacterium]|nr:hypothetical protein [Acidobacteriota bacterium]